MEMKGLFLDDERNPEDVIWMEYPEGVDWVVVRTHGQFLDKIDSYNFDIISFDHDIQDFTYGVEITGHDCVKSLIDEIIEEGARTLPKCVFHTQNPVGKGNMWGLWNSFLKFWRNYE